MRSEPAVSQIMPLNAALKYNPHLWGDDELRAIFAVRQKELQELVDALHEADPGQTPQHLLITGHRGMGKTTLLRRLALSIADTPELAAKWLPLTFPEEQYTVRTLAEFWFNVLDALADALSREGASPAELMALDARIERLTQLDPSQREAAALDVMTGWIAEHQRGMVLLIDSSDQLFSSLSGGESSTSKGDASATTLWRLRNTLSHQPGLFWIGASYETLESQNLYHDTFHDFFALHELIPLAVDEMRAALLSLARSFGAGKEPGGEAAEQEMARILDTRPERLNALRVLTGGNPRATVMLYELFATDGEDSGQADLKILLDLMTPLYKARMEALSDLPRKLFAHLMEHWHPMGISELVEASGIPSTTISGQLSRMETAGLLEKTVLADKKKRAGYQATERLFNVWYLMRSGSRRVRQRLAWLVEFMRMWYSRDELELVASQRSKRHGCGELNDCDSLEYSRAVAAAMGEKGLALEWSVLSAAHRESCHTRQAIAKLLPGLLEADGSHAEFKDAAEYLERFTALDAGLSLCPYVEEEDKAAWVATVKGSLFLTLEEKEWIAQSATTLSWKQYEGFIHFLENEEGNLQVQYGKATIDTLYAAVRSGDFFPDCRDSKLTFAQLEHCFSHSVDAYCCALEFFNNKQHDAWVEKAYRRAIELNGKSAKLWNDLGNLMQLHLKHYKEAESAYRRAIELDEKLAYPWNGLGNLLQEHLKRYDEAETAYRRAIELDEKHPSPWNGLGNLLQSHLKRYEEAESAYRRAIKLNEKYASPWNGLGNLLQAHLKRYDEAETAYRRAIELDDKNAIPWNGFGNLLQAHLKRSDEAESAYRRAIELNKKNAYVWANLARLQAARGERSEATGSYRKALEYLANNEDVHLHMQAHLWLDNRDLAAQALNTMAQSAGAGDAFAFFRLREQCRECYAIGLGQKLAELMEASSWEAFLLPFSLALRAAMEGKEPVGAAPEVLTMAAEVLQELREVPVA